MGVSKNNGTPKSSVFIGFSLLNHPYWGTPIFGNTHMNPMNPYKPKNRCETGLGSTPTYSGARHLRHVPNMWKLGRSKRLIFNEFGYTPLKFNMEAERSAPPLEMEIPFWKPLIFGIHVELWGCSIATDAALPY